MRGTSSQNKVKDSPDISIIKAASTVSTSGWSVSVQVAQEQTLVKFKFSFKT